MQSRTVELCTSDLVFNSLGTFQTVPQVLFSHVQFGVIFLTTEDARNNFLLTEHLKQQPKNWEGLRDS